MRGARHPCLSGADADRSSRRQASRKKRRPVIIRTRAPRPSREERLSARRIVCAVLTAFGERPVNQARISDGREPRAIASAVSGLVSGVRLDQRARDVCLESAPHGKNRVAGVFLEAGTPRGATRGFTSPHARSISIQVCAPLEHGQWKGCAGHHILLTYREGKTDELAQRGDGTGAAEGRSHQPARGRFGRMRRRCIQAPTTTLCATGRAVSGGGPGGGWSTCGPSLESASRPPHPIASRG
jgi:hypothetical protein